MSPPTGGCSSIIEPSSKPLELTTIALSLVAAVGESAKLDSLGFGKASKAEGYDGHARKFNFLILSPQLTILVGEDERYRSKRGRSAASKMNGQKSGQFTRASGHFVVMLKTI